MIPCDDGEDKCSSYGLADTIGHIWSCGTLLFGQSCLHHHHHVAGLQGGQWYELHAVNLSGWGWVDHVFCLPVIFGPEIS